MGCYSSSTKAYTLKDGSIFEGKGKMKNGFLYNGEGTVYYINGSTFEGNIKKGQRIGIGTYTQNEDFKYVGEWSHDTYHGKGEWTTTQPDETGIQRYVGDFRNGRMTGSAVVSYNNGCVHKGNVLNGNRSGQGTMENTHHILYTGQWANNQYRGYGARYYDNGEYYEGYFKKGKKNGRGTYSFTHANRVDAEWVNDIPNIVYSGELPPMQIMMEDGETYQAQEARECVICMDHKPGVVYLPCRHCCVCSCCPSQNNCPICRKNIIETVEPIYC